MIQFDGCIFFKWVGEKPPTSQLIISKLVHILSLGFQDASLPSSMCEISLLSSLQTWQSFFEACEKPGWRHRPTKKDFTTKKHKHVKGDEHRFFVQLSIFWCTISPSFSSGNRNRTWSLKIIILKVMLWCGDEILVGLQVIFEWKSFTYKQ